MCTRAGTRERARGTSPRSLKIQVRKGETNYLRISPPTARPIGLLRAVPFILFFHFAWENDRGLLARRDYLVFPLLFPPPSRVLSSPCPPASTPCVSSVPRASGTSPLEAVAPSGSARSPNLPTDPHDFAAGIMVPAPKIEHARHEAPSNLF